MLDRLSAETAFKIPACHSEQEMCVNSINLERPALREIRTYNTWNDHIFICIITF